MLLAYKLHILCVCAEALVVCDFHAPVFGYDRRKQCVVVRLCFN